MTDQLKKTEETQAPRKKRRWLRVTIVLLVLVGVVAILINGPIGRWIVRDRIVALAEDQQLFGEPPVVEGTLLSGYTISDIDWTGVGGLKSVQIESLSVRYHVLGLFERKIDRVELSSATVVIDLADFPEPETEENTDLKALVETIRPWVLSPDITIEDVDVTVLDQGELLVGVALDKLDHSSQSESFIVTQFVSQNAYGVEVAPQDFTVLWGEGKVQVDKFTVLPRIEVLETEVDWSGELKGNTTIRIDDALVEAKVRQDVHLKLLQGDLSSAKIKDITGIKLPVVFSIEKLELAVANWTESPELWDVVADVEVSQLEYEEYRASKIIVAGKQRKGDYEITIQGELNEAAIETKVQGKWTDSTSQQWWESTSAEYSVIVNRVGKLPQLWLEELSGVEYSNAVVAVKGEVQLENLELHSVSAVGSLADVQVNQKPMPRLDFATHLSGGTLLAKLDVLRAGESVVNLNGSYQMEKQLYEGKLRVMEKKPDWINTLLDYMKQDVKLLSGLDIFWQGKGNIADTLTDMRKTGEFKLAPLKLSIPEYSEIEVATAGEYSFPDSIRVKQLRVRETDWQADGSFSWDGSFLDLTQLNIYNKEKEIGKLVGNIPLSIDTDSAQSFFQQEEDWKIEAYANPVALAKIKEWFSLEMPEGIEAITDSSIRITGSPSAPVVSGHVNVLKVRGLHSELKQELNAKVSFNSVGKTLKVNTSILEGVDERVTLSGLLPFTPRQWIKNPELLEESILDAAIDADLDVKKFPISRVSSYLPELEKVEGFVSAKGKFTGSINDPKYKLEIISSVPLLEIDNEHVNKVKKIEINSSVTQDLIINAKITAEVNGGAFELSGKVDVNDTENPSFDLSLLGKYALAYRNDFISFRLNADLKLKGTLEDATISGDVGIVETLFYKDIELIPIGVPSSAVAEVQLPVIQAADADKLPIPAPFDQWKLDVVMKTEDPILIRGNVAKGSVRGSVRVQGTTALPSPQGSFYILNTKAKLPFSELLVKRGEVKFTPKTGLFNPELNIGGTSTVAGHKINLLVHGNVSSPGTSLTSSPPLPEAEIMSLLGTGLATSSLASSEAVALKTFQVFLQKMKQRQTTAAGNRLFKVLLRSMQDLNIQVGQSDKFTGRKFTSASLEISPRWYFTTQIDEQQESRWLLVYLVNFK